MLSHNRLSIRVFHLTFLFCTLMLAVPQLFAQAPDPIEQIQTLIQQEVELSQLDEQDSQTVAQQHALLRSIWTLVQSLPIKTLETQSTQQDDPIIAGWAALGLLANTPTLTLNQLSYWVEQLNQWQMQYPDHPAEWLLPNNLTSINFGDLPIQPAEHIGVLLPLTGKLHDKANAIRNGILTAYYADPDRAEQPLPTITFYDTTAPDVNVVELYQQVLDKGTDLVIGPLVKANVEAIRDHANIVVPTIALNTIPPATGFFASNPKKLYQFGLSPKDEAKQMAQKAIDNNLKRALVIVPDNPWGHDIEAAFAHTFDTLGGHVIDTLSIAPKHDVAKAISDSLRVSGSQGRAWLLQKTLHEPVKTIPRRRYDIDFIFIATSSTMARQVVPLLKFYYANDLPMYAVSRVYNGLQDRQLNKDLNGVAFCDIPLLIDNNPLYVKRRNALDHIWKKSYENEVRLYALGFDAYDLTHTLNRLAIVPDFSLPANTGRLQLMPCNHIGRVLPFAKIQHGVAKPLP